MMPFRRAWPCASRAGRGPGDSSLTRTVGALCMVLAIFAGELVIAGDVSARGGSGVLSRNGRVGSVTVGRSTVTQVRRYAGRPSAMSSTTGENGVPGIDLRYDCGGGRSSTYIFGADGRLANFLTTCRRWRTANGTRIGDTQATAEANEGKQATSAECGDGETIERTGRATLFVTFFTAGGLVRALAVAGRNSVLGC
jgi:hypothetical protein